MTITLEVSLKIKQVGDSLHSVDQVREENGVGMNRIDWGRWPSLVRPEQRAALLVKYQRQIAGRFGEDVYRLIVEAAKVAEEAASARFERRGDRFFVVVSGKRVSPEEFRAYIDACKSLRMRWEPSSKEWHLPYINPETVQRFREACPFFIVEEPEYPVMRAPAAPVFKVRKVDGKYAMSFPFHGGLVAALKNKGGRISGITEWNPDTKERMTKSIALVDEIKALATSAEFGFEWSETVEVSADRIADASAKAAAAQPIPEVAALLASGFNLFAFQNEGVKFLNGNAGNGLIGMEMGLGKTLVTLAWAASNKKRLLVICPKVVRRQWLEEATKFFPAFFDKGVELRTQKRVPVSTDVKIATVNYESLSKFSAEIAAGQFDALVIDESHRMKNPKTKCTKAIQAVAGQFQHKILLSGTAVKNKKEELFTQIELVAPGRVGTRQQLKMATIGGTWNQIADCYFVRTKKDVATHLPPKLTQIVKIDVEAPIESPKEIGEISRAKNDLALSKVDVTVQFVQELLESSDSKILVFSDSVEAAERIVAALGKEAVLHHGQMTDDRREAVKKAFQDGTGSERVFVSTRQSLSVGANMTAADKVVFNDLPWTAADLRQAEDRAHRMTSTSTVNVYWMTAANCEFDSRIAEIIMRKYELNKKLNEGKQLSAEETKWMTEPVKLEDLIK